MIKTIMFEDDTQFRNSISLLLSTTDDIEPLASFSNANDALREVKKHQPDVVLMDIEMPGTDGLSALSGLRAKMPDLKVMMLTSFEDEHRIFAAITSGASGYALKGDIDNLEQGIRDVHHGGGHFSPSIALRVMKMLKNPLVTQQNTYVALTKREQEVLQKMVEGNSRKMIAAALNLSILTINDYIKDLYVKLHVNSAPEAVREAIVRRLV
jgi:DNA-binding NarL/FixJ family response regulator